MKDFYHGLLAAGWTAEQIGSSDPTWKPDDGRACLAYASEVLQAEKVRSLEPA